MSLAARALEESGITTVVIGSAYDIVTTAGVPRYLYNDLPLGNPLGKPGDRETQRRSVERALTLARDASEPGQVLVTDVRWSDDDSWKANYSRVGEDNIDQLRALGEENRRQRKRNRELGLFRD